MSQALVSFQYCSHRFSPSASADKQILFDDWCALFISILFFFLYVTQFGCFIRPYAYNDMILSLQVFASKEVYYNGQPLGIILAGNYPVTLRL